MRDRAGDERADRRLRRPRAAAVRPDARRRLRARLERDRARSPTRSASARSRATRGRSRGSTPCTTRRTSRSTSRRSAATCCSARRTSSAARISASRTSARELAETWRPYKARPSAATPVGRKFETGTLPYELLAGFSATIAYLDSIGGMPAIREYERALGELPDREPAGERRAVRPADDGRPRADVPLQRRRASRPSTPRIAWPSGAWASGTPTTGTASPSARILPEQSLRAGLAHYNTRGEVDRLLDGPGRALGERNPRTSFEPRSNEVRGFAPRSASRAARRRETHEPRSNHVRTWFALSLANQISLTGVRNPRGRERQLTHRRARRRGTS